jgi:hypothetical protein
MLRTHAVVACNTPCWSSIGEAVQAVWMGCCLEQRVRIPWEQYLSMVPQPSPAARPGVRQALFGEARVAGYRLQLLHPAQPLGRHDLHGWYQLL